jgi:hypothetical protein
MRVVGYCTKDEKFSYESHNFGNYGVVVVVVATAAAFVTSL